MNINLSNNEELVEKVRNLEDELERKTNILNNINHELRNPIHGICGILQFLKKDWDKITSEERKQQIDNTAESALYLRDFIDTVLDLSKFEAGKMIFDLNKIDLIPVIQDVINTCNRLYMIQKEVKLEFEHEGITNALAYADISRIKQLLLNLFTNGIKFTSEGTLLASLKSSKLDGKDYWKFKLSDQGIGIPNHELDSIFKPFIQSSRTRTNFYGTGLGLAICKEIAEAHNGKVWAENNEHQGATLTFIIPLVL